MYKKNFKKLKGKQIKNYYNKTDLIALLYLKAFYIAR